jgi:hypothetical protein
MDFPFMQEKPVESVLMGKGYIPVDRIKQLAQKGFSEQDMIDVLRKEGFSPDEIDKGLTEALKEGVGGIVPPTEHSALPTMEELQPKMAAPVVPEAPLPEQYYATQQYPTEEYVEYLVKERTSGLDQKLGEFTIRYSELEKRLVEMSERLNAMASEKGSGEQLIISKIDSMKDSLVDMESKVSAFEKAFKDTLPALIESVRALSNLAQKTRREEV